MSFDVLITILLVLLNGFFVAAEFAMVKVRSSQVELWAEKGGKRAKTTLHIIEHLDSYLSATQLGITLASLALGWIGEDVVSGIITRIMHFFNAEIDADLAHKIAIPIGFTVITAIHIVFGEQVPKITAIKNPLKIVMLVALPMRAFYVLFSPFVWFLNHFSALILRLFGINDTAGTDAHSEEELRMILTESEESGAIKQSENELIQNVFDFDDRVVKQIMVPQHRISALDVSLNNEQVIRKIIEEGYSRLPVYSGDIDNIIGIVHSKDLLKAVVDKRFSGIRGIMRPAHFIPENMKINDLLRDFQRLHAQIAIVSNEFGATAGIVTMEDIIEELVGEIRDEHDDEKPDIEKLSETEFIIKAQTTIVDVNESLPIALPENPHYDTVSGYINFLFGRIPAVNEKHIADGYLITILKRKKQNVELINLKVVGDIE
ncbi:MAG: HlyC/CorC family transporter [Bacteroidetes bacterium]|nr:HlyC/CorC family transporter [Bacteroidota bacterium]